MILERGIRRREESFGRGRRGFVGSGGGFGRRGLGCSGGWRGLRGGWGRSVGDVWG